MREKHADIFQLPAVARGRRWQDRSCGLRGTNGSKTSIQGAIGKPAGDISARHHLACPIVHKLRHAVDRNTAKRRHRLAPPIEIKAAAFLRQPFRLDVLQHDLPIFTDVFDVKRAAQMTPMLSCIRHHLRPAQNVAEQRTKQTFHNPSPIVRAVQFPNTSCNAEALEKLLPSNSFFYS